VALLAALDAKKTKIKFSSLREQNRQKFRCQFFLDFFCFIVFSGAPQRWEFKGTTKNVLQKNRVEKFLQKNRQKSKTDFFSILCITFLGVSR
jgi:hypothetical protein